MIEGLKGWKIGCPVPEKEALIRLDIDRFAAPIVMDFATVYRLNDTFMDVTDQTHLRRHFNSLVTWVAISGTVLGVYLWVLPQLLGEPVPSYVYVLLRLMSLGCIGFFGYVSIWSGRGELFSLSRKPIRFNRLTKRIYAIRNRRFFRPAVEGDLLWEFPWASETIFCVYSGEDGWGKYYYILCYEVDASGNLVQAVALGRRWEIDELDVLLAQWNYWCIFMNEGPSTLPVPMLYIAEHEDVIESFFMCMYSFGFSISALVKIIAMPLVLPMVICRRMSLATCREPRWPAEVIQASKIHAINTNEPSGSTPIGWKGTIAARHRRDWPDNPHVSLLDWRGRSVRSG